MYKDYQITVAQENLIFRLMSERIYVDNPFLESLRCNASVPLPKTEASKQINYLLNCPKKEKKEVNAVNKFAWSESAICRKCKNDNEFYKYIRACGVKSVTNKRVTFVEKDVDWEKLASYLKAHNFKYFK